MSDATRTLFEETTDFVEQAQATRIKKPWEVWLQAEWGLRNYWYPAALSHHVGEGGSKHIIVLGEEILLTRQNGVLYAVENRCPHRGTRFSSRPLFYTKETITCWYHTWTFDLETGELRTILNEPGSKMIGKCRIKSYPVTEQKGIVFVFVGDIEPPAVHYDVAPGLLDENAAVYAAEPYDISANWRLGCENGYDPGHQFIHNWSQFCIDAGMHTSYGYTSKREDLLDTTRYQESANGPKGFTRRVEKTTFNHTASIPLKNGSVQELVLPLARGKSPEELQRLTEIIKLGTVGLWLPCSLKVTTFPLPHCTHYEFYVPKDRDTHTYFQFGVIHTDDAEEAERWLAEDGHILWEKPVVDHFTVDDAFARREMQKFYGEEEGWRRERLYSPDIELTMWRRFASKHARGIQTKEHTQGHFKR